MVSVRFAQGEDYDDRQYLRVKIRGGELVTILTPFRRGERPADLAVSANSPEEVVISYTNKTGVKRAITVTRLDCAIADNGTETARERFADGMPEQLYPQWTDEPYRR